MGMEVERWRQVAIDLRVVGLLSASSRAPEDDNQNAPEFPAASDLNPDVMAGKRQLSNVLKSAIGTLPERYQSVVRMYYVDGKTMREIGDRARHQRKPRLTDSSCRPRKNGREPSVGGNYFKRRRTLSRPAPLMPSPSRASVPGSGVTVI